MKKRKKRGTSKVEEIVEREEKQKKYTVEGRKRRKSNRCRR